MSQFLTRASVVILAIFAGVILLYAFSHTLPEPQALDARGSDVVISVGKHQVTLRVRPKQTKDEGVANIEILVDARVVYTLQAEYNYDLWQNEHPLWYWHTDHDQDGLWDLLLRRTADNQRFWVRGSDGNVDSIK